jgi:hypothetical protein
MSCLLGRPMRATSPCSFAHPAPGTEEFDFNLPHLLLAIFGDISTFSLARADKAYQNPNQKYSKPVRLGGKCRFTISSRCLQLPSYK